MGAFLKKIWNTHLQTPYIMNQFTSSNLEIFIDFEFNNSEEKSRINQLVKMLTEFDLVGAEEYFDKDYKDDLKMNRYNVLAALDQVLKKFKLEGDTKLAIKRGYCSKPCYSGQDEMYQLVGNNSGNTFDFGFMEKENKIVNFYSCMSFVDCNGKPSDKYQKMCFEFVYKLSKMMK